MGSFPSAKTFPLTTERKEISDYIKSKFYNIDSLFFLASLTKGKKAVEPSLVVDFQDITLYSPLSIKIM